MVHGEILEHAQIKAHAALVIYKHNLAAQDCLEYALREARQEHAKAAANGIILEHASRMNSQGKKHAMVLMMTAMDRLTSI